MSKRHVIHILSLIFLLYFSGLHFDLSVVVVRPADLLLIAWLSLVAIALFTSGRFLDIRIRFSRTLLVFGMFVLYRFLNGLFQSGGAVAVKELAQSILIISFAGLIAHFCDSVERRQQLLRTLRYFLVFSSILLFIFFVQRGQPFGFKTFGPFKHFYGLAGLFALSSFFNRPSRSSFLLLSITVAIMLLSGEKKGWIALSFSGLYLLSQLYLKANQQIQGYARLSVSTFFFVAIISLPTLLPTNPYLLKQFNSLAEVTALADQAIVHQEIAGNLQSFNDFSSRSNFSRFHVLSTALEQVQRTPLFGIGPQNLKALVAKSSPFIWMDPGAHNDYLNTLVEYGAIGLTLQLLLIILLFRYSKYLLKQTTDETTKEQIIFIRALLIFGIVINAFFGGSDALNSLYILAPAGLLFSINSTSHDHIRAAEPAIA